MSKSSHLPLSHEGKCTKINSGYWGLLGHRGHKPQPSQACPLCVPGSGHPGRAETSRTWAQSYLSSYLRDLAVTFICDRPGRSQRGPGTTRARTTGLISCSHAVPCQPHLLPSSPNQPAHFCGSVPTTDQSFSEFGRWAGMTTPSILLSQEDV